MPKLGMEPVRKSALIDAAIAEIGRTGSLDVTVSQIAKKAGMSSALAHHYFGSKDQIFLAAMRHILRIFGAEVRGALSMADTPRQRLAAIVRASFSPRNFQPEVISAWLNFYVQAQTSEAAARLLQLYQRRLHSNLVHDLRGLGVATPGPVAEGIAALIDGVYIRQALRGRAVDPGAAMTMVTRYLDLEVGKI